MSYEVVIKTTNGLIRTEINDLKELEDLLIKYYEVYISVNVNNKEQVKKKVRVKKNDE